jgi:hypothetical protein
VDGQRACGPSRSISVADSHRLIVPRVRTHLGATFNLGDAGKMSWVRHGFAAGLDAHEAHLARKKASAFIAIPQLLFAERLACGGEGLAHDLCAADVVGKEEDETGVEGGTFGLGQAGVGLKDLGVEAIGVGQVGLLH